MMSLGTSGSVLVGGVALRIRKSTMDGLNFTALPNMLQGREIVVQVSNCTHCTADTSLNSTMAIINTDWMPALPWGTSVSCDSRTVSMKALCDRGSTCSDGDSGYRCGCPFGFMEQTDKDGSACVDLCASASSLQFSDGGAVLGKNKSESRIVAQLSMDATLLRTQATDAGAMDAKILLVPKSGQRTFSLVQDTRVEIVQPGSTPTGVYELQLRSASGEVICPLIVQLEVGCAHGWSPDGDKAPCMPDIVITRADVQIKSSTNNSIPLDGDHAAGDRLTVELSAHDIDRKPIDRATLGLAVNVVGRSTKTPSPSLPFIQLGSSNLFKVEIPETWTKEPEVVESGVQPLLHSWSSPPSSSPFACSVLLLRCENLVSADLKPHSLL
jgi:hypothetical protein